MPAPASPAELLEVVRLSGVLDDEALNRLKAGPPLPDTPVKLAAALVQRGLLTQFQAKQMLAGRHRGFKLGAYIVRDQVARGGMGAVYLAEHETLRRKVALKVLTADKDPLAVKRFAREARSAAALDHPNIVRLFDVAKHGEVHYLVMEFADGRTMEQLLADNGPLPYTRVVGWVAQVAAGLQHAHERGFVHRDIKPANLIVTKAGVAKILDMGLARSGEERDKLTEMMDKGAVVGTADYIAPEQAIYGQCDIRADIYALGATFHTLVTGKPPFEGSTTQKLVAHQMKAVPNLADVVAGLPPDLAAVVATMMAKKPEDRYQTPAEVVAALAPWAAAGEPAAPTSSVDLAAAATASGTGLSTGRMAKASVKTAATPASAVARAAPTTGRVNKTVTAEAATARPVGTAPEQPIRPDRADKKPRPAKAVRAAMPGWMTAVVAGVCAFVTIGVGGMVAYTLTRDPDDNPNRLGGNARAVPSAPVPPAPVPPPAPPLDVNATIAAARDAAVRGQWKEAADKYVLVMRDKPEHIDHWRHGIALVARAGDLPTYNALRTQMIGRFRGDGDPRYRGRMAKACLLLPASPEETAECAAIARDVLQANKPEGYTNYFELSVALAEYRLGEFAAADARLDRVLSDPKGPWALYAVGRVVRALSLARLGQVGKARELLAMAADQMKADKVESFAAVNSGWQDWLMYDILRREAEKQLDGR